MTGVNKVILIGNLGKDPQLDYTASGTARCRFSIATTESYADRDGQKQERTEWHNIVLWARLAEIAGEYLKKGRQVYIEGQIRSREYEDTDGARKWITEIVGNQLQMLGTGGSRHDDAPPPEDAPPLPNSKSSRTDGPRRSKGENQSAPAQDDDDLPF